MKTKNFCFLGLIASIGFGAFAQAASTATISATTTDSSLVVISGQADPTSKWIWIHVAAPAGQGDPQELFPAITNGTFSQKVYLRSGSGAYQIQMAETSSAAQYLSPYYVFKNFSVSNTDAINRQFLAPSGVVQSDDPAIVNLAFQIITGIQNPMDQSKAIHDWVATHTIYDLPASKSANPGEQTALSTLNTGKGVCAGYARLNAALHRAVGLQVKLIIGVAFTGDGGSGSHEWNEVLIPDATGNHWIIEDPTWDSGAVSMESGQFVSFLSANYFNPDPTVFAQSHQAQKVANE